jgi:hypothetical protein
MQGLDQILKSTNKNNQNMLYFEPKTVSAKMQLFERFQNKTYLKKMN